MILNPKVKFTESWKLVGCLVVLGQVAGGFGLTGVVEYLWGEVLLGGDLVVHFGVVYYKFYTNMQGKTLFREFGIYLLY
jgi:hypothetical protein